MITIRTQTLASCRVVVALAAGMTACAAQSVPPPSAPPQRSAAALEQLVQPITSYPDYLVGIILPASVYPLELGDAAFQLAQTNAVVDMSAQSWDPSVKSLAQFPSVVQWMDRNLPWTVELGRAFVAQQKDVLDAVQRVRAKAYSAGTLKSDAYNIVTKSITGSGKETITIVPVTQPAGASPPAMATAATTSTSVPAATTTSTVAPSSTYSATAPAYPPSTYYSTPPPSSSSAASAVVGVAALAVVANNVDWDEKYVIDTPGGVVVVDEDDLEEFQENRPTATPTAPSSSSSAPTTQSSSTAKTASRPSTQPANKSMPSTQPTRQPAPSTQPAKTPWQPNSSRMASSGAPQPSTASQSPAARGWSQPSASGAAQPRPSPSASSSRARGSRLSGWGGMSEGARARDYSGRGASSRSGGRSGGRSGR